MLEGEAHVAPQGDWINTLCRERNLATRGVQRQTIRLIPYYAWANWGISETIVWHTLRWPCRHAESA
jgi:DUF1680 family protein